jgi:hypothetical protein
LSLEEQTRETSKQKRSRIACPLVSGKVTGMADAPKYEEIDPNDTCFL